MNKFKRLSLFLLVLLTLSIVLGNFSLPAAFAYEKKSVNFEQVKTEAPSDNSGAIFNKLDSLSKEVKSLPLDPSIAKGDKTGLGKAQLAEGKKKDYVEGEILVKYKKTKINLETVAGRTAANNFSISKSMEKKEDLRKNNISVLKIKDTKTVEQKIAELKNDPNVESVQPNFQYYPSGITTNDTNKGLLWGLDNTGQTVGGDYHVHTGVANKDINAPEAWAISEATTSALVIVAVIDSGVAYNHPDLATNMWNGSSCKDENGNALGGCNHGYDYQDNDKTPLPTGSSHGTHIAGTIAAVKNNSKGIIGVAPQAKIMAIKSSLTTTDNVKSINFAQQNGAKIINASWGGPSNDPLLKNAIETFTGLFIAAAGNETTNNENTHSYPSDYNLDNIISVAATDQNDSLATFSNYGVTSVDVGAPGTNIYSTIADTNILNEIFDEVTVPNVPSGWVKGGINNNWGTYNFSGNKVLYGDLTSPAYDNNASTTVTSSPTHDLGGNTSGATISFGARCDTEYSLNLYDYMSIQISSNGGASFSGLNLGGYWGTTNGEFNEAWLDNDTDPTGGAYHYFDNIKIPSTFLTSNFKFRLGWKTDGSLNTYDGCFVDDIKITRYSDGSDEKYDYYKGTSMAAPHVAGLAALIEGYNPNLTTSQVKNIILTTGDSVPALSGKTVSGNRINAQKALQAANPAKAITSFSFVTSAATSTIDEIAHTIAVTVPSGTNVIALVPTIVITGVSVSPTSGVAQNFISPVTYTVTAADTSTQAYVVTVTVATPTNHTISGIVKYYDGVKVIPNATVILENGVGAQIATTTTNASGTYQFTGVADGGDYVVRVSKSDNTSGLTGTDQTKIRRHIVGLELFDTIYKNIAGDVNNSGGLTGTDQTKIRRFIVGLDSTLPSGVWKFYTSDAILTTTNYLTVGLTRTYTNLTADTPNQDFVGIKMGDVNNSWGNN